MTGFIFLDKPSGITSFTASNLVRKICKVNKTGHTGTLDPMATGVLPVMLGGATRFSQYLPVHDKSYTAKIRLGVATDTLDITGEIIEEKNVNINNDELVKIINTFIGEQKQLPPMYSAISKNGVRLYELARKGIEIEREARDVNIYSIDLLNPLDSNNEFTIDVSCSAGTYIRSLSNDIGEKCGCGAVLLELRRTNANGISIDRTVTLEELRAAVEKNEVEKYIVSCDEMLNCYPKVNVSEKQAVRFENGGELDIVRLRQKLTDGLCRVYSPAGILLGLGKADNESGKLFSEKKLVY